MAKPKPRFITPHADATQIAMPLGGLGAGCICLNGQGGLQDFSIRNRPDTTALPDSHDFTLAAFALLRTVGTRPVTRLVEGPLPPGKTYDQSLQAQGYRKGGHEGLPRFRNSLFLGGYPFGRIELSDPQVPLKVSITGWNPFIPRDDIASGLPCAILEYDLRNPTRRAIDFEFSYHLSHLAVGDQGGEGGTRNAVIPGRGIYFHNTEEDKSASFGSAGLTVLGHRPRVKGTWLRGGWFDAISALWREIEAGEFQPNDGRIDAGHGGRSGGSILVRGSVRPGASVTLPVVITWYFPNGNYGADSKEIHGPTRERRAELVAERAAPKWHPERTAKKIHPIWQRAVKSSSETESSTKMIASAKVLFSDFEKYIFAPDFHFVPRYILRKSGRA